MTVLRVEQQRSRLAGWCRGTAAYSAMLLVVAGFSHRFGLLDTPGFLNTLGLVAALALLALVFGAISGRKVWVHGDAGAGDIAAGILMALLVLAPFAVSLYWALTHPDLNDVATDTIDPPRFVEAVGDRKAGMNPVKSIGRDAARKQLAAYPEVTGRRYDAPQARVLQAVAALVERQGWQWLQGPDVTLDNPEITLEALAHTLIFGFSSDVAIRITDEGTTTYVDMRSASRYGNRDLGDNAARIVKFLDALDADVAAQAGTQPAE